MSLTKILLITFGFLLTLPVGAQELSSSRRSGIHLNVAPQYFYSRLERQQDGGENFSMLSESGARVEIDLWGYLFTSVSLHFKGEYNTYTFSGPASRTFPEESAATYMAGLRLQWHVHRDIKIFLQGNQQSVIVMQDTPNNTTHEFHEVPVTTAMGGLWLTAESDVGFGLDVELFAGSGAGEGEYDIEPANPVTMGLIVGAKSKLSFGERKRSFQWGVQSTVYLQEHEQSDIKYITSNAAAGFFIEMNL